MIYILHYTNIYKGYGIIKDVIQSQKLKQKKQNKKMKTQNTKQNKEKFMKKIRKENKEQAKPSVFLNKKTGRIEIHYNSKTILAVITDIDNKTNRDDSDQMALGSGYKELNCRRKITK